MEESENCIKDSLELYEGNLPTDSQLKFKYCGSQLPNVSSFTSVKNELLVVLTTDGEIEAKGFKLGYAMVGYSSLYIFFYFFYSSIILCFN